MNRQDAARDFGETMYECTGPICGPKQHQDREKVRTPGTYCSACSKAISNEARGRKFIESE